MPTSLNSTEPEYELKHRLTGAAILMLIAVVVIPLLLSEPTLEANTDEEAAEVSVQTFRSRIVPLNIDNVNGDSSDTVATVDHGGSSDAVVVDARKPALLDLTGKDGGNAGSAENKDSGGADESKTALVMTREATSPESDEIKKPDTEPAAQPSATTSAANSQSAGSKKPEKKERTDEETLTSGWVVRVGTFSKKANVDSVSALLTNSGFNPKTKPVETSLGKSTRVWLGPYAKRETADKISDRLKSLIGEKGYVTRTSS